MQATSDSDQDDDIASIVRTKVEVVKEPRTDKQQEIVEYWLENPEASNKEVVEATGYSPAHVSETKSKYLEFSKEHDDHELGVDSLDEFRQRIEDLRAQAEQESTSVDEDSKLWYYAEGKVAAFDSVLIELDIVLNGDGESNETDDVDQ